MVDVVDVVVVISAVAVAVFANIIVSAVAAVLYVYEASPFSGVARHPDDTKAGRAKS